MGKLIADSECSSILHERHEHRLFWDTDPVQFTCNGCREIGWGASFRCEHCKFHLHDVCAKHEVSISLPFLKGPKLEFIWCTFGHKSCTACGGAVKGCGYHQRKEKGYSVHPLCAKLPAEITDVNDDLYGQRFYLHRKLKSKCCLCGSWKPQGGVGKLSGWSYRSTCKKYHVHVSCAKELGLKMCEMVDGTVENNSSKEISQDPDLKMMCEVMEKTVKNSSSNKNSLDPDLEMICEVMERTVENYSGKEMSLAPNLKMISKPSGLSSRERKIRLFCKVGRVVLRVSFNILIAIVVGIPIDGIIALIESVI